MRFAETYDALRTRGSKGHPARYGDDAYQARGSLHLGGARLGEASTAPTSFLTLSFPRAVLLGEGENGRNTDKGEGRKGAAKRADRVRGAV